MNILEEQLVKIWKGQKEGLQSIREKAHKRLVTYLDLKEEQNLTLNNFSLEATNVYQKLIDMVSYLIIRVNETLYAITLFLIEQ